MQLIQADEEARLADLYSLRILDTPAEERFDRITRLALRLFGVPMALVTFMDMNRQWFKACQGLSISEVPRNMSFCALTVLGDEMLVIPDALADSRFADNPLVTGEQHIRFYAGLPLKGPGKRSVGTVCLLDRNPRQFDDEDRRMLRDLAALAQTELGLLDTWEVAERAIDEQRRELGQARVFIEQVVATSPALIMRARRDDLALTYVSPNVEEVIGYSAEEVVGVPMFWVEHIHPEDRERFMRDLQLWRRKPVPQGDHEYRFRRKDGAYRWLYSAGRFEMDGDGHPLSIQGCALDITERKLAEERVALEAARARALLRVAAQLNAQRDLDTVVRTVCDETARAMDVPIVTVSLLDPRRELLFVAGGVGLAEQQLRQLQPVPLSVYARYIGRDDAPLVVPDVQALPELLDAELYALLDVRTGVEVSMWRDRQLVGRLTLATLGEARGFTQEELMLLQGIANQAAQAIANARLYDESQRRLKRVQALRDVEMAISGSLDLRLTLSVLLERVLAELSIDAAAVLLLNQYTQALEYAAERGFRGGSARGRRVRLGEGATGRALLEKRPVRAPCLRDSAGELEPGELPAGEDFAAYYAMPLVAKGRIKGLLEIFHRAPLDPEPEWLDFLETLAGQAAIAVDNAQLFEDLDSSNLQLALAYDTTLEGWAHALDLRDRETEGHSRRVTELTVRLARAMGIGEAELVHIRRGALLHDIGKMGIPDGILLKPGKLSDEEWVVMRMHPTYAYELLGPISFLRPALDIPYAHHEKWDGSGYPRGLKGEAIPLPARLFAVVDVWDALRSDRPYRAAMPAEQVREHILSQAGSHFDPKVVELFLQMDLSDGSLTA